MASWKKVVVQGANISDAALVATEATVAMNADSILFVDNDDSKIKRDTVDDFVVGLRGSSLTGSGNSGITSTNGVLKLNNGLNTLGSLDNAGGDQDLLLVYDTDATEWKVATASTVGSAGTDTNTTYSLSSSVNAGANEASLVLTDSNDPVVTDTIKFSGDSDITLTQSGNAAGNNEDIAISLDEGLTGVKTITNDTQLTLTSQNLILKRDADNEINFATDNVIKVKTSGANRVEFTSTTIQPTTNNQISLGTADSKEFKDAHFAGTVTAGTGFSGPLTGDVTGLADKATAVITTASSDNSDHFFTFVNDSTSQNSAAGGSNLEVTSNVKLNPSTGIVTASGFSGPLTGAVTGNADSATEATSAVGVSLTNVSSTSGNYNMVLSTGSSGTGNALAVDTNLSYNPGTDTLTVTNLEVAGTEIKVNTENLTVTDKLIEVAVGSANAANASGSGLLVEIDALAFDATANDNAGNQADVTARENRMPELKWSDGGQLAGWTISNYKSDGANTDFGIAVNHVNAGAPSDSGVAALQAGTGAFYTDTTNGSEALYVYL